MSSILKKPVCRSKSGFNLTELMVVIAIIVILMLLFLPQLWPHMKKAEMLKCKSNLRQMGVGCFEHARDTPDHSLSGVSWEMRDYPHRGGLGDWSDNLNFLYPDYVATAIGRSIFVCPASDNFISDEQTSWTHEELDGRRHRITGLRDLKRQSNLSRLDRGGSREDLRGVSYEINSYFSWIHRKTTLNVGYYEHIHDAFGLAGHRVTPDEIYLIFDGDANGARGLGFADSHNNYPDPHDNHGRAGVNRLMCDGSVNWVNGGEEYIYAYELSQDENRTGIPNLP